MAKPVRAEDGRIILRKQSTQWLIETLKDHHAQLNSPADCFGAGDIRNHAAISDVLIERGFRFEDGLPVLGEKSHDRR